ncbi:MAG TPA: ATP-binding cassette domain-containing protein [Marinobacter sp.]|nr:ATP-binding cassette domain-containing protein [Marinobacter sp.]
MPGFDVSGLTASFGGERVLGPLSLRVSPGEKVALVGKSGAGKSTLIKLLYERLERKAALIPQGLGLVNALPVFHNVFLGRLDQHPTWYNTVTLMRPFKRDREAIRSLMHDLGIGEKLWVPAASLSGGQRQRVAIARALYRGADILLADEPISALDGPMAHQIMRSLTDQYDTSVIALHDVDMALAYCNRIIGIQDGEIALDRRTSDVKTADIMTLY